MNKHLNLLLCIITITTMNTFGMRHQDLTTQVTAFAQDIEAAQLEENLLQQIDAEIERFDKRLNEHALMLTQPKIQLAPEVRAQLIRLGHIVSAPEVISLDDKLMSSGENENEDARQDTVVCCTPDLKPVSSKRKNKTNKKSPLNRSLTNLERFWIALTEHRFDSAQTILIDNLDLKKLDAIYKPVQCTPLVYAVTKGDKRMVESLLRFGANVNAYSRCASLVTNPVKITPFCAAIMTGQLDLAQLLLDNKHTKANVNLGTQDTSTNRLTTALTCATQNLLSAETLSTPMLQKRIIQFLLKNNAINFAGNVIFMDHGSKSGLKLDLSTFIDKSFFNKLYSLPEAVDKIYCHKGDIILLGDKLDDVLEKVVINRTAPEEDDLSSFQEVSISSEEVIDFTGLTLADDTSEEN